MPPRRMRPAGSLHLDVQTAAFAMEIVRARPSADPVSDSQRASSLGLHVCARGHQGKRPRRQCHPAKSSQLSTRLGLCAAVVFAGVFLGVALAPDLPAFFGAIATSRCWCGKPQRLCRCC